MEALQRANVIRIARAQLKRDLKSGNGVHLGAAERPAGVGADGQGVRPPAGRAEVRPREGRPSAHDLPHLAVEDGRRPVRAPAGRAGRAAAPVARAGARDRDPVRHLRAVRSGQGHADPRRPRARPAIATVAVSATTRRQREGEVDGREYYFLGDDGVPAPGRRRRVRGARLVRRRPLRHAEGGGRPAARGRPERDPRARGGGVVRDPAAPARRVPDLHRCAADGARTAAAAPRHRDGRRDRHAARDRRRAAPRARRSSTT